MQWIDGFRCCIAGTVLLSVQILADPVAEPPAGWRERVQGVPELVIPQDDAAAHEVLVSGRRELAELLLAAPRVPAPRLGDAYGRLAALYQAHGVVAAAEICYRNATRLSPGNFRWQYYFAELLRDRGRYREALERYDVARELNPDYPPLPLRMAQARYELGELDVAGRLLEPLLLADGLAAAVHYELGRIALLRKAPDAAAAHFRQTLELDPAARQVNYPLAQALRALGENAESRARLALHGPEPPRVDDPLYAELLALRGGPRVHFIHALQAVKAGDYGVALRDFEQGLSGDPDNARARVSYARALYLNGDAAAAGRELQTALQRQPDNVPALFLLGLLADEGGETALAEGRYRRVLALQPGHAGAGLYLAGLLYRAGRYAEAARRYAVADPDVPFAPVLAVLAAGRAGASPAAGAAALRRLVQARPDDPVVRYALARVLLLAPDPAVRDPAAGLAQARQLIRVHPAPPFQALLALAFAANGEVEQAELQLQQLAFLPPWVGDLDLEGLKTDLAALKQGDRPGPVWPAGDPLLQPPPVQATGPMRDYPVELPY